MSIVQSRRSLVGNANSPRLFSAFHRPGLVTVTGVSGIGRSAAGSRIVPSTGSWCGTGRRAPGEIEATFRLAIRRHRRGHNRRPLGRRLAAREAAFTDGTRRQPISWFDELLVLDDAGYLLDAADQVRSLLQDSPDARLLVTSPGPLGVRGEQVLRLGPLWLAEDPQRDQARPQDHPSVQLFIDRATTASVNLNLEESDYPVILELCQLLDGIPFLGDPVGRGEGRRLPACGPPFPAAGWDGFRTIC